MKVGYITCNASTYRNISRNISEIYISTRQDNIAILHYFAFNNDTTAFSPHVCLYGLTRNNRFDKACIHCFELSNIIVSVLLQYMTAGNAIGTQTMKDRSVETCSENDILHNNDTHNGCSILPIMSSCLSMMLTIL